MQNMKVMVTGATGFLGLHICSHLRGLGLDVVGTTRKSRVGPAFEGMKMIRIGENLSVLQEELNTCDAVVHLMARTHRNDAMDKAAEALYRKVNVDATLEMLNMSVKAKVKKFIYMSSIKAVGEGEGQPYTEISKCRPKDLYGVTKLEAEKLVLSCKNSLDAIIVRIPMAYGPGVKGNFLALLGAVNRGLPLPLGSIKNARSLVYSGNLSDVTGFFLRTDNIRGVYHICDKGSPSTPELIRRMGEALDKKPRLISLPTSLLMAAGKITGKGEAIYKLTSSLVVKSVRSELAWLPPFSLTQGLLDTAHWFKRGR